jgi:hypothetical protein
MKPKSFHTKPTSRRLGKQPQKVWAYTHSQLTDEDVRVVAAVFGVTANELLEISQNVCCAN